MRSRDHLDYRKMSDVCVRNSCSGRKKLLALRFRNMLSFIRNLFLDTLVGKSKYFYALCAPIINVSALIQLYVKGSEKWEGNYWPPYISDLAADPQDGPPFIALMFLSSLCCLVLLKGRFNQIRKMNVSIELNMAAYIIGIIAFISSVLVLLFTVTNHSRIHFALAFVFFFSSTVYQVINYALLRAVLTETVRTQSCLSLLNPNGDGDGDGDVDSIGDVDGVGDGDNDNDNDDEGCRKKPKSVKHMKILRFAVTARLVTLIFISALMILQLIVIPVVNLGKDVILLKSLLDTCSSISSLTEWVQAFFFCLSVLIFFVEFIPGVIFHNELCREQNQKLERLMPKLGSLILTIIRGRTGFYHSILFVIFRFWAYIALIYKSFDQINGPVWSIPTSDLTSSFENSSWFLMLLYLSVLSMIVVIYSNMKKYGVMLNCNSGIKVYIHVFGICSAVTCLMLYLLQIQIHSSLHYVMTFMHVVTTLIYFTGEVSLVKYDQFFRDTSSCSKLALKILKILVCLLIVATGTTYLCAYTFYRGIFAVVPFEASVIRMILAISDWSFIIVVTIGYIYFGLELFARDFTHF